MASKGLFIVLEGIDGCGKSSQATQLVEYIFSAYKKVDSIALTHEPTHSKFGLEISRRLSQKNTDTHSSSKERLVELFVLDREKHVDEIIAPLLEKKAVVVCDRYKYSNIAYQSAQGVLASHIIEENAGFPIPDLVVLVNTSVENCIARMQGSGKEMDKFEKVAFLEKVRAQFLKLPPLLPKEKFHIVNGNQSLELVHADIVKAVKPLLDEITK